MSISLGKKSAPPGVNFVLEDTADRLTNQDLLRIIEISEQAHTAVHVSQHTHQLLIGVPEFYQSFVAKSLSTIGFKYVREATRPVKGSTYVLTRKPYAAVL